MAVQIRKQHRYEDLTRDIRSQIEQGVLRADHYLLPENDLAKKYKLSVRAVREGLGRLETEGWIRRHQGRGTIVLPIKAKLDVGASRRNIGVIFQGRVSDASTAEELDALQQTFQEEGYGTTLYIADGHPDRETEIVNQMIAESMPGLIAFSAHPQGSFDHFRAAMDAGMKVVVYDHDFPQLGCNFFGIDDRLTADEATSHLIRLGCQELLMINVDLDWTTTQLRQQGFEQAAARAGGLPFSVLRLPPCESLRQSAELLSKMLPPVLETAHRSLGILAWCDEIALRTIEVLQQSGWSVPGDAKIMGIGNDRSGADAPIPLSTMEIPRREMMRLAATALVNQMRFPNRKPRHVRLKTRMILRESCGTYPARSSPPIEVDAAASVELEESLT